MDVAALICCAVAAGWRAEQGDAWGALILGVATGCMLAVVLRRPWV